MVMIWMGLIIFSVLGLCLQGLDTFWAWILIAVAVVALVVKSKKNSSSANKRCKDEDESQSIQGKMIEIPEDAHDAVETFARLV